MAGTETTPMRFGPRIRELRRAKNLSLRALAEAVGARWATVGGPTSVVDALAVALTP